MASTSRTGRPAGPYMLQELVDNLPLDTPERQDVTITCLESWGANLYVGTSAHEILHLVSIPATPNPASPSPPKPLYILASRLQPLKASGATGLHSIKQILVLPSVSKALVLSSSGLLSFYSLPEFSPAFSGTKLKEVLYIGGLDLEEEDRERAAQEELADRKSKAIMVLAKGRIRMIRIGNEARLVKDIPLASSLIAMRRGNIACVATHQNYALLDVENIQRIPLFPLSTYTESESQPSPETRTMSPRPPEPPTADSSPALTPSQLPGHPPQSLSVAPGRERRNSSAAAGRESIAEVGHIRSSSTGNMGRSPSRAGRRPISRLSQLSPPESGTPRAPSPLSGGAVHESHAFETGQRSPAPPEVQTISSPTPTVQPPTQVAVPAPTSAVLKPHVASPSAEEFLLTTGTKPEDPGVGMFVSLDGEVTRSTIQFNKYPEQLLVQDSWVIAVVPGVGLEMQRWDLEDERSIDEGDRKGTIALDGDIRVAEVIGLDGTIVSAAGQALRLVRVPLKAGDSSLESSEDQRRNEEERLIAQRISTVESRVIVFSGQRVWTLLRCPLSVRLDSRLPNFSDENFDGIIARVRRVLNVLEEVRSIEPSTETEFHEVSYVRQKCGLLVLGELLRISQRQTADITAPEIMTVERALLDSALDPRFIVALFGDAFHGDIVEGSGGVWVYGGIEEVFKCLTESDEVGSVFTREVLLLLKRYLGEWRSKKGFGSVADDKKVFLTVDAALLRVLLMLDSPEYLGDKGKTVVQEGNIRTEIYAFVEAGTENFDGAVRVLESFGRFYVLSILYAKAKMFQQVLNTWRRILEEGETTGELVDGEQRVKNYLLKMKDPKLVEEFGGWLAARNAALGIQVFADESAKVKFDSSRVLEILRERAPGAVRAYVEYLVVERKNSAYSNELIFLYLSDLVHTLSTDSSASEGLQISYESYRALSTPKPTYRDFIIENLPPSGAATWFHDRLRLFDLLCGSSGYDVEKVFEIVQQHQSVLVPEMVILHGRSSQHASAVKLLVHDLKDFDTAINYCLFGGLSLFQTGNISTPTRSEQSELFTALLDEFLKLEDISERIEHTSELLEKFGGWLDVTYVLSVIPDSWSIEILGGFLISALRQLVRQKADVRVERQLGKARNLRVEAKYVGLCDEIGPTVERQS